MIEPLGSLDPRLESVPEKGETLKYALKLPIGYLDT